MSLSLGLNPEQTEMFHFGISQDFRVWFHERGEVQIDLVGS